jgi:hypothetical protein
MDQAREAAAFVCELSHLDPAHSAKRCVCVNDLCAYTRERSHPTPPQHDAHAHHSPRRRWCVRLLESLEGKEGGATAPLGVLEQRELGRLVASRYLATAQGRPRVRA